MENQNSQHLPDQPQPNKPRNVGCMLGWIGLLIGFSPLILAYLLVYTVCGGNGSETSCGAVGAVFLLPFTLIAGFVLGIVGIFKYLATPPSGK